MSTAMKNIETSLKGKKTGKRAGVKNPDADKPVASAGKPAGKGRVTLANMPEPTKREEIKGLLEDLKATTDTEEKKRIRRSLRARGHFGGLGGQGAVKKDKKEVATK